MAHLLADAKDALGWAEEEEERDTELPNLS
jgi:hypothetical protein